MSICYILLLCFIAVKTIFHFDKESGLKITMFHSFFFLAGAILGGIWIDIRKLEMFSYGILVAYLLVTVYTDCEIKKVHDLMAYVAAIAGFLLLLFTSETRGSLAELGIFLVLQKLLFARLIGEADCIAFGICAMYMTATGGGIMRYLFHMLLTVVICGIVQLFKRNINNKGNMKQPVAFTPYIAVAAFVFL